MGRMTKAGKEGSSSLQYQNRQPSNARQSGSIQSRPTRVTRLYATYSTSTLPPEAKNRSSPSLWTRSTEPRLNWLAAARRRNAHARTTSRQRMKLKTLNVIRNTSADRTEGPRLP